MQKEFIEDIDNIWHNIFHYSRSILTESDFPLTKIGFYDITALYLINQGENIQVKDVCVKLGVAKSTMTSILKRLESAGYIVRSVVEHDKRGFYLELTDIGIKLLNRHEIYEKMVYSHILEGLSEKECKTLITILNKGCGIERKLL